MPYDNIYGSKMYNICGLEILISKGQKWGQSQKKKRKKKRNANMAVYSVKNAEK